MTNKKTLYDLAKANGYDKSPIVVAKNGLYANIHAKRARIAAGSGESMRKPGEKGAPTAKQFVQAAKTAKAEDGLVYGGDGNGFNPLLKPQQKNSNQSLGLAFLNSANKTDTKTKQSKSVPAQKQTMKEELRKSFTNLYNKINTPIVFGKEPGSIGALAGKILTLGEEAAPGVGYSINPLNTAKETAINVATGEGIGAGIKYGAPIVKQAFNKVATGNSFLPVAWKLEQAAPVNYSALTEGLKLTDEEAKVLAKYVENPYSVAKGAESELLASLPKKYGIDLKGVKQPLSKIQNYYVSGGNTPAAAGNYGERIVYPRARSWSFGLPESHLANFTTAAGESALKSRLVMPSRYSQNVKDFMGIPYNQIDPGKAYEMELFGHIPEGLKVIGSNVEGGFKNIFVKPVK